MTGRQFVLLLAWLTVLAAASACTPALPTVLPVENGPPATPALAVATPSPVPTLEVPLPSPNRLVIGIPDAPGALDPHLVASPSTLQITRNIYQTLVETDEGGVLRPGLAQKWVGSEDARHWLFWLRPDARFHDGRPVTGEDVAYTIERLKDQGLGNPRYREYTLISTVVVSGTHLVGLHLSEPDATFPYRLAADSAAIVPDESGDTLFEHPIGSGPYELKVWAPAQFITLQRSEEYSGTTSGPAEIAYRIIPDDDERVDALRAGQVDIAVAIPLSATLALKSDPNFRVVQAPAHGVRTLALNERVAPWGDPRARQAIARAIDRNMLVDAVWSGQAVPVGSELSPSAPFYTDTLSLTAYDPTLARTLLQESAITFTRGTSITLTIPADEENQRMGEEIARLLNEVGISVELQPLDWIVFMNQVYFRHEFVAALTSHLGKADPLLSFTRYMTGSEWNYVGYASEEFERLVGEAERTTDALARLQVWFAQDGPGVYLASPLTSVAMRNNIKDCYLVSSGGCDLKRLRKEQ